MTTFVKESDHIIVSPEGRSVALWLGKVAGQIDNR